MANLPTGKHRDKARRGGVRGWRIAFLLLCTVGFCLAADLARLHVNVHTDPEYHSYCAVSERVNCDTVAASDHSVRFGLPMSIWGMLAYFAMGALAVWGLRSRLPVPSWPFGILFWLNLFAVLVSLWLYYVSHYIIESICPVCVATYLVNLALFAIALRELRRVGTGAVEALRTEVAAVLAAPLGMLWFCATVAAVVAALWLGVPRYWVVASSSGPGGLTVGRTAEGHPWIGARNPVMEIVEFSDYQCPHCLRGHREMRQLIESRPEQVRLIHRHYPLDQECNSRMRRHLHPLACAYSRLAFCAGESNRFWEANDFLFLNGRRKQPVTADELAGALEIDAAKLASCSSGATADATVREDIEEGARLGVRGTPTFVVNGRAYPGRIPPDVLGAALATEPTEPR